MPHIIIVLIAFCLLMMSCDKTKHDASAWDLTIEQQDSIDFLNKHHYGIGYNFIVRADSLTLVSQPLTNNDSIFTLKKGDQIAVADFEVIDSTETNTSDSVWIKVAHDQNTIGWTTETELLKAVTPDDPISEFIQFFSTSHFAAFSIIILLGVIIFTTRRVLHKKTLIVHFNDIATAYPTALCLSVSTTATFYAAIRMFYHDVWTEFYFYPTLNPFGQPAPLFVFLALTWTTLILAIATADDVRQKVKKADFIDYMTSLMVVCLGLYLFFTLTTKIYIGFPLLLFYYCFAIKKRITFCTKKNHPSE